MYLLVRVFYFLKKMMRYSMNLLEKFININSDLLDISNNLTLKTCEVEEIIKKNIDNIIIWYVDSVEKHKDADKLFVCKINCWENIWQKTIITWWENIIEWKYVPVILPWSFLSSLWFEIWIRKMRWIDSYWMVCSKWELWIPEDEDKHWIWILNEDFEDLEMSDIWKSITEKYPWLDRWVLDVENKTLTNRPDLTWHFWLSVELKWIYSSKNKVKFNKVDEYLTTFNNTNIEELLTVGKKINTNVEIKTNLVNSYVLLWLENVSINKTTFYSRNMLYDLWLLPRNNRVDFSNIFLYLVWQPIHFFDADKVKWNIIVRTAKKWEEFIDLFEKKHLLEDTDIVICDNEKILALAGVVWWQNSWIDENTKNILVEIANFDAVSVRKTWVRLWLRTDAELRFEKNINPIFSLYSVIFFLDFIKYFEKDLWSYDLLWNNFYISDIVKKHLRFKKNINFSFEWIDEYIFWEKKQWFTEVAKRYLSDIWFKINWNEITVPFWRSDEDINIKEDIIEEIIRLYWYENISSKPIYSELKNIEYQNIVTINRKIEDIVVKRYNFVQMETYPWTEKNMLDLFNINLDSLYSLKNPVNSDAKFLRDSMMYNLLEYVKKNSKFFDNIKIFDIWKTFSKKYRIDSDKNNVDFSISQVWEKMMFWWLIYKKNITNWKDDIILEMKKIILWILSQFWLSWNFVLSDLENFHPNKQSRILINSVDWKKEVWFIWVIHPIFTNKLKFNSDVQIGYISFDLSLFSSIKKQEVNKKYETLQDQIIWRDLCFLVDKNETFEKLLNSVKNIKEIEEVDVFDLYEWKNIWENKKSISFKFKIIWDWNLTTEWINKIMDLVISECEKTWAELRK